MVVKPSSYTHLLLATCNSMQAIIHVDAL